MAKTRPLLKARNPGTARRCELLHGQNEDTLYVYGVIGEDFFGDGIASIDVVKAVQASTAARLNVRINSPGGDVFEGVAMANVLRTFGGEVVAYVDGLAASAATLLTSAASKTFMAKGAMLMVHHAWTVAMGNADDLIAEAALLKKIDGQIAAQYAARAGVTNEVATAWMDMETWFSADEAVNAGLADGADNDAGNASARIAQWDLHAFASTPAALLADQNAPATEVNLRITVDIPDDVRQCAVAAANPLSEFEQRSRAARLLALNPA